MAPVSNRWSLPNDYPGPLGLRLVWHRFSTGVFQLVCLPNDYPGPLGLRLGAVGPVKAA